MFSFCCLERLPACLERLVCLAPCAMSVSDEGVIVVGEEVDLEALAAGPVVAKEEEEEKDAEMVEDTSGGAQIFDASGDGLPPAIPKPRPAWRRGEKRPAPVEGVPFFKKNPFTCIF